MHTPRDRLFFFFFFSFLSSPERKNMLDRDEAHDDLPSLSAAAMPMLAAFSHATTMASSLYSRPARCRRVFDKSPMQVYFFFIRVHI
jgi:hypothetical protein